MTNLNTLFSEVRHLAETTYGLRVVQDLNFRPGFDADLDGLTVFLKVGIPIERALFALLHLFGHCVQWNTDARKCRLGQLIVSSPNEASLAELMEYEREAHGLGLTLLLEANGEDLRDWYAAESAADLLLLVQHYGGVGSAVSAESSQLAPVPVPEFAPQKLAQTLGGRVLSFR